MSNKFCRELSNGYKINVEDHELTWSPCCYYFVPKKPKLLNRLEFKKAIDYASSATTWLPECKTCSTLEATGISRLSPRLNSFKRVPEDVEDGVCVDLEISFDINCNAACLSCSGGFSTTWQKYDHKHQLFDYGPVQDHAPRLLDQLISTVPMNHLRQLFILGGEPFYSNTHFKLLKHVEQVHPDLKKIELWYQTNGSLFPDEEVRKLWTKFKRVVVGFSLDGINDRFEYLRYPLTWERLTNTVSRLLEETDVVFNFNSTISPLNVLYFQDLVEWVHDTIPLARLTWPDAPVRLNQCWYPMDLSLSTPELREACLKKYGENHPVTILFKKMPFGGPQEISKMFNYIQKHDAIRQLDWRKTFSEVVPFYKNIT